MEFWDKITICRLIQSRGNGAMIQTKTFHSVINLPKEITFTRAVRLWSRWSWSGRLLRGRERWWLRPEAARARPPPRRTSSSPRCSTVNTSPPPPSRPSPPPCSRASTPSSTTLREAPLSLHSPPFNSTRRNSSFQTSSRTQQASTPTRRTLTRWQWRSSTPPRLAVPSLGGTRCHRPPTSHHQVQELEHLPRWKPCWPPCNLSTQPASYSLTIKVRRALLHSIIHNADNLFIQDLPTRACFLIILHRVTTTSTLHPTTPTPPRLWA